MNPAKIPVEGIDGPATEDQAYFLEAARRLEKSLGPWLSYEESIALMQILLSHSFKYEDGFVLNDRSNVAIMMGVANAAVLAACFCRDPDRDWSWWKADYPRHDKVSESYLARYALILAKMVDISGMTVST